MIPDIENGLLVADIENGLNAFHDYDEPSIVPEEIVIDAEYNRFTTPVRRTRSYPSFKEPPRLVRQRAQNPLQIYKNNGIIVRIVMRQPSF